MPKPPLANNQNRPQSAQNRPMGNAQARNPALAPAPAYGNTTNPTGSQTAGRKMAGIPVGPPNQGPILPYSESLMRFYKDKSKTPGGYVGPGPHSRKAASFGQTPFYSIDSAERDPNQNANDFFGYFIGADNPDSVNNRVQQIQAEYEDALRAQQQPRPENFAPRSQQSSPMMGMPAPPQQMGPAQPTGPPQQAGVPDNVRRQGNTGAVGGLFRTNSGNAQQRPDNFQNGNAISEFFAAQPPQAAMQPQQQSAYAGGDVAGISAYYRNAAKGNYQGGMAQVPLSPLASRNDSVPSAGFPMPLPLPQMGGFARSAQMMAGMGASMAPTSPTTPMSPLQRFDQQQTMAGMGNTTDQINALTRQSQIANPMMANAPMAGVPNMQGISDARMAPMMARDAAMQQNTPANGFVAGMNDPNRLTPDMKEQIARSAVNRQMSGGPAADPTGMFGRFNANTALGQGASEYERGLAGVAAGEGVMIQPEGRGSNPQYLGFNSTPEDAFSKAMASSGPENPDVKSKYRSAEAINKRKAFASEKAGKAAAFREANDGMNYKQVDRLEKTRSSIQRKMDSGKISSTEGKAQIAAATAQQIRRGDGDGKKMAGIAAPVDRVRLPTGELPEPTRVKAQETASNMTNPEFTGGSLRFQQEAGVVRSIGLKPDESAGSAMIKIRHSSFPMEDPQAALRTASAYRTYWGSMRDKNRDWGTTTGINNTEVLDPQVASMMNELVETPEKDLQSWIDKYSGHLAGFGYSTEEIMPEQSTSNQNALLNWMQ